MYETVNEQLKKNFYHNKNIKDLIELAETDVLHNRKSSFQAAHQLLETYFMNTK